MPRNSQNNESSYCDKAMILADAVIRTSFISGCVTLATAPYQNAVTHLQQGASLAPKLFLKSFSALPKTLIPQLWVGQTKGFASVTSKGMINREDVIRESEHSLVENNIAEGMRDRSHDSQVSSTFGLGLILSQIELAATGYHDNISKLKLSQDPTLQKLSQDSPFKFCSYDKVKLAFGGHPIRSVSTGLNYVSMLVISPELSSWIPLDNRDAANLFGGGITGIINNVITHPIVASYDRLVLESRIESNGRLTIPSTFSFFKGQLANAQAIGVNKSLLLFLQSTKSELFMKSMRSAMVFGLVECLNGAVPHHIFTNENEQLNHPTL